MQCAFQKKEEEICQHECVCFLSARTSVVHEETTERWESGCICGRYLVLMSLYVSTPSQERSFSCSIYLDYFFFCLLGFYCLLKKTYLHYL